MLLRKLAISNFAVHRTRVALTLSAIALAVSLVVAVTSGYASLDAAARKFFAQFLGAWDAQVTRPSDPRPGVDSALVDQLRADPAVRRAVGRLESDFVLLDQDAKPVGNHHVTVFGIDRGRDDTVESLRLVSGRWFDPDTEPNGVVIDQGTAKKTGAEVGDTLFLPSPGERLTLKVTGIVHKPGILADYIQTMYVALPTLQRFLFEGRTDRLSKIQLEFHEKSEAGVFVRRWQDRLKSADPLLLLKLTRERRDELDQNLRSVGVLSYLGGTVSMLAATFIVFSTVSMGVSERQRMLAMLRAVGLLRVQVLRLVLLEGLLLGVAGVAIGVPLGLLWVSMLVWKFSALFTAGMVVSFGGVSFAALGTIAAGVVASILPAISAARVDPVEAMASIAGGAGGSRTRPPVVLTLVGLALISIDSVVAFAPPVAALTWDGESIDRDVRFYAHLTLGLPGLMIGFFLLAPLFVWIVDRLLSRPASAILGVRHALLRQQLSGGGLWRSAGTCAALMVGLSVLVVMQTQGHTALASWQIPDKFPDVFIYTSSRAGLSRAAQEQIAGTPGIRRAETMPIAMFSPQFGGSIFGIAGAAVMPNATMYFGIDPDKGFDMMHLDFRQGNPKEAAAMLKKGGHLIVTEEFYKLKGLGVGDTLSLISLTRGKMDFIIAGVVWSPGIDVMVSRFDLGKQFEQRTAASVFGTLDDARNLFGIEHVYLVAANLETAIPKEQLIEQLRADLGDDNMNVADVRQLKHDILSAFHRLLLVSSAVAWSAMLVASLGVTNAVMASVRSRRWQFGVLRSIGVTRDMLVRLVLAESLLLGVVAVALGLSAGMLMALNAHELWGKLMGFAPPMTIPWHMIAIGSGAIVFVSILASLVPAFSVGRQEPLALLQAGRAAA